jgi:Zn-dependent protease with chaperone function
VVTPRWMETLKSDPDAATAVVVHELSHREEASRTTRYLVTLTFGTWPVLFVVGALYNVGSLHSDTSVAPAILRLAVTLATPSLAYGLGYLGRARASRALELRADTKVASVGYAPALIRCLADSPKSAKNAPEKPLHQLIESLTSSHPSPQRRIEAINRLGPLQASDVPGPLSTI